MAARVFIELAAENNTQQAFRQAEQSLQSLENQTRDLQGTTRATAAAVDNLGNQAQASATGVTALGRQIFRTQEEAKRFNGVWRSLDGRLREANGRFVSGREAVQDWTRAVGGANRGGGVFAGTLGNLRNVLAGLGIAAVTHEVGRFGVSSVQAAGQMEQLRRATEQIQGSAAAAETRIAELIEVANLPGLNFEPLVRYANQFSTLGLSAEDTDKILLGVGQTVVSLGGTSASAEQSLIQLLQAFRAGTIDMRDFRTVITQIPGILEAAGDVHGVEANIEGLREAFEATEGSMRDLLIPIFDELSRRFEAPPADSYIVAMDTLQNAFFLTQATIGDLFLPAVTNAAIALAEFFESVRAGINDVSLLPQPIQDIVAGAKDLYEGLLNIAESIQSSLGPEINELIPALASLLGGVLDLVGSIANALAPVYELWNQVNRLAIALITKLANDLNGLIGVLTGFIDWVASAWRGQDQFAESTNRVTEAIEGVEQATKGATGSVQQYAGDLRTLLEELASVNTELEQKKKRFEELKEQGFDPAEASMAQIQRQMDLLRERSETLTASLPDLNKALEDVSTQLASKRQRLNELIAAKRDSSESAQQLQRQIATLETVAALLNAQIALTNETLTETPSATDTATEAVENYSLTLARLKARAEDARETLSSTIDFQQLSANYQAAIAESDAYYNRQIANAEAALAKEEENTDEYRKLETDLFELRREQVQARKKLTEDASKVGETEAKRRIAIAEEENELLREAGKETARALEVSQKAQAAATAETQKELARIHQENLKEREEAERASNERIIKASEDQLAILENIFENSHTEGVNQAYQNIQRATIEHYETLKSQARQRITDEDALTAELVSLDRQRNAALGENHRDYLQRIASDAKKLLGERTEAFQESSGDILHDWERTVSEFERQLREADTEDAIRQIEQDFEAGQQSMLASLESVLIELGFTAEQAADIMKNILQTAESESDSFADKIISAFKRLGKEVERETKRQNKELEKSYRELIDNIGDTIGQVGDLLSDGLGGTLENVFSGLVRTASGDLFGLVDIATAAISFIQAREEELHRRREERAKERQEFENEQSIRVQNIQRLQSILPDAESNIRRPRPLDVEIEENRGVNRRRAVPAELQDLQGITLSGVTSDVLSQLQSQQLAGSLSALTTNLDDIIQRSDIEEIYSRFIASFETAMDSAGLSFQTAIDRGLSDADIEGHATAFLGAINDFYDLQIEQIRDIEAATGNILFDEIQAINNLRSERLNQARLLAAESTRPNLTAFGFQRSVQEARATAERTGTDRQATEDVARAQYGDEAYDAEAAAAEVDQEALKAAIESINEDVALINASILSVETQIEQASEPAEIAELLSQVPDLIREKYRQLREALNARLYEGEISQDVFDASLSELASSESRDLESHSDTVLANTIQAINEDVALINASVVALQTQIEQASEPAEIAELLSQVPDLIREKYQQLRDALDARYAEGEISTDIYNASLSELASGESAELEQHSDAVLANTLRTINEDVQLIDASISALQTQINQLNEPEAIAELLSQLPALIQEKYQTLRTALDTRYAAGEISLDVYNASLSQLESRETAELESHSDQVLANTLRAIDEDAQLVNASITALQNQIDQTSEPAEIARLLDQLPALITEKYRLLRNALDEKYAAGEISTDVYNASLSQLASSKSAETENQSDAVLANTLADIDDDVELIDANIGALQAAVEQSDDPEAIVGLLDTIKILVMDKYNRLRDRLSELHAAEEISADSYNAALTALGTAESNALANIDDQALNAISEAAQEQVNLINSSIENLRLSLELTDDPEAIQGILEAIRVLTAQRFDTLIQELHDIRENLSPEQFNTALKGLELGKQVALDNIDTEKFTAISAEAQKQVDFINGSIENLRLSFQLTDDPTEQQQILDAIKVLTASRFAILRDELEKIKDDLDPEEYEQALTGINLGEQLALDNIDTEKFQVISEDARKQVDLINGNIENLRLSLQLTDDLTEQQDILTAIKVLTAARFQVLREELEKIRTNLDPEVYNQALRGLNLGEQLAIQNINTEAFNLISAEAQKQVDGINGSIENLRLSLELTDDPAERQGILDAIKVLVSARFDILRDELEKIKTNLDPDEYERALTGLNLGEEVALRNIDTEKFGEISEQAQKQVAGINADIENLRLSFELTDDPAERQQILDAIKILTAARFDVLRDELEKIRTNLSPEDYDRALRGLNLGEQVALRNINTEQFQVISEAAQDQVNLINGAIDNLRLSLQLADDPAQVQAILESIKILTVARFDVLIEELENVRENLKPGEYEQALRGLELGKQIAVDNINTEQFQAISDEAQKQVDLINGTIENLRLSLQLTDDPAERQEILDSIKVLTVARFDILIEELEKIRTNLTDEQYAQALRGLQLGRQIAVDNIDTEKFGIISEQAQQQVDLLNSTIENLRLSLQLTDDPTERQQILDSIKILTAARFDVLIQELKDIRDSFDSNDEFEQALEGLELGKQVALNNIDTEKFSAISAAAQKQVDFINGAIENLRLSFELTDDPTEQREIIDAIKILTAKRFEILRDELIAIRDSFKSDTEFNQALQGLNLGERLALSQLDTERFGVISEAAQEQVDFINGAISNLELSLQLTDDPDEIQRILASIRILTAKRFDVLIDELKELEDSFDNDAEFKQALEGLQLGKQVALKGINDRSIGVTLAGIDESIGNTDSEITQLFDALESETTDTGVRAAIGRLRTAIEKKYELLREKINESADTEEEKARQIAAVDFQEGEALGELGRRGLGQFDSLVDTAQFLLDNATEAEFATRRQGLIDAINTFYDERTRFIENQDLSDTDRANMLEVARIQREIALGAVPEMHASVIERLELEHQFRDQIADLRADELDAEADYHDSRVELAERTAERLLDIERRALRSQQDSRIEYAREIQDLHREATQEIAELLEGLDPSQVRQATSAVLSGSSESVSGLGFGDSRTQGLLDIQRELNLERQEVAREQRREFEDIALREERGIEDVGIQEDRRLEALDETRNMRLTEIAQGLEDLQTTGAFTELGETLQATAALESQTALTAATTATTQQTLAALESETAGQNATNAEMLATSVSTFQTASETLLEATSGLATYNLDPIITAITGLPQGLDSVIRERFSELPRRIAEAISDIGYPASTEKTPLPFGAPNRGQPIIIQNVMQVPDGVLHYLNDTNAVFTADGRTVQ